jgi:hypothetical protein
VFAGLDRSSDAFFAEHWRRPPRAAAYMTCPSGSRRLKNGTLLGSGEPRQRIIRRSVVLNTAPTVESRNHLLPLQPQLPRVLIDASSSMSLGSSKKREGLADQKSPQKSSSEVQGMCGPLKKSIAETPISDLVLLKSPVLQHRCEKAVRGFFVQH